MFRCCVSDLSSGEQYGRRSTWTVDSKTCGIDAPGWSLPPAFGGSKPVCFAPPNSFWIIDGPADFFLVPSPPFCGACWAPPRKGRRDGIVEKCSAVCRQLSTHGLEHVGAKEGEIPHVPISAVQNWNSKDSRPLSDNIKDSQTTTLLVTSCLVTCCLARPHGWWNGATMVMNHHPSSLLLLKYVGRCSPAGNRQLLLQYDSSAKDLGPEHCSCKS